MKEQLISMIEDETSADLYVSDVSFSIFKFDMEAFIFRKKGCLLDCLNWVPNRGACIDACLS